MRAGTGCRGNEHFKRQEFALAVDAYNRAIELNPEDPSRTAAEQLQTARSRRARGAEPVKLRKLGRLPSRRFQHGEASKIHC